MLPASAHESVHAAGGLVAAPHTLAVEAGAQVLAEGGNAIEAAVATAATLAVVYPHMTHLGGDGFWLIHEPSGRVRCLMAAGPAARGATIAHYRELGLEAIPARGPHAALTVPGALAGWQLALEAARAHGGRMGLPRLLERAIHYSRLGITVSASQACLSREKEAELKVQPGFSAVFLPEGKPPPAGALLRQERLADTLDHLSRAGLADFYRGDVGREMAADLERISSPLRRSDLVAFTAREEEPLQLQLPQGTVYNAPPPTQGLASLLILGLFARLRPEGVESFGHIHGLVEATKQAFLVRDRLVCDPGPGAGELARLLSPNELEARAARIDPRRALAWPRAGQGGDTVWLGAADASGLVVSMIQSIYFKFGSGCVLPATGVVMQNRGVSFALDPRALNALAPGRRPFHTLNPALAVLKDGRVMAYGTMGGEGQPQTQAAVFTRHVLYGVPLGEAIARPRWLLGRTWGAPETRLQLESRFDEALVERLRAAGHDLAVLPEAYSDVMGHAGAVVLRAKGGLEGAHDPRADGGAAGV